MAVKIMVFIKAFLLTLLLFLSVYSLNLYLNSERERAITDKMSNVVSEFEEVEALTNLMKVYGQNATCIALDSRLKLLDTKIWKLGEEIDTYRQLSKDYMNDPYYQTQKEKFNRQEVLYLSLLKEMDSVCSINQTEVLYFYRKGELCSACDQQAYVLNYINNRIDSEISVFSFDADLDVPSVGVLMALYNITEYPSLVVGENVYPGLKNLDELTQVMCDYNPNLTICSKNT